MPNKDKIFSLIKADNKVKLAVTDIDGILRGKVIHKDKFFETADKSLGFCDVIFGWDINDACYNNTSYTGWHSGYPDANLYFDQDTFRNIPWDNNIPFFLCDLSGNSITNQTVCPRSLLKYIRAAYKKEGLSPVVSFEYEWFNFIKESIDQGKTDSKNFRNITPGMFGYSVLRLSQNSEYYHTLFDSMEKFDVKLEGLHTETGPGVFEAAIRYDDAVNAADKANLFKTGVKEISSNFGILASFMAKWNKDLPGCGSHIHQSIWNADKSENLFFAGNAMSELFEHYLAGQLHCLPYILPMYAPTINSYKRLTEGAWAPTTLTWGYDNRTTAFRVLTRSHASTRLETRVAGADANPYLAASAALASGLYGIKHKLKLDQPPTSGSAYNTDATILPATLAEATAQMKQSDIAIELFGETFTNHFISTREWEVAQYRSYVSAWELERYFEII